MNFSQEKKEDIMSPKAKSKDHLDKESQKQQDNNFNKLLKDNALNDNIDKTIHNYHIYIKAINMLLILFNVMFTEYLW